MTLAKSAAELQHHEDAVQQVLIDFRSSPANDPREYGEIVDELKRQVSNKMRRVDAGEERISKRIRGLLQLDADEGSDDDVDIQAVERELVESDFKCPYTGMRFEHPMKRCVPPAVIVLFDLCMAVAAGLVSIGCHKWRWTRCSRRVGTRVGNAPCRGAMPCGTGVPRRSTSSSTTRCRGEALAMSPSFAP